MPFGHTYKCDRRLFLVKKWHRYLPIFSKYMALPTEVMLDLPRITIIGQIHVYIENHQGIAVFSDTELTVKATRGSIQILGSSFVIKMMYPEEILLEGKIDTVKYIETNV